MLSHHLEGALSDLRDIIEITNSDINDIKEAHHDAQFGRLPLKEEKIKSFESKKAMIDYEISSLMTQNPGTQLPELLDKEQHEALAQLRVELSNLRKINKKYAKFVLSVSNLYNSFLERLVPTEMNGYEKRATSKATLLQVRA